MSSKPVGFSPAKVWVALLFGYGCAIGWVVYADVGYDNNVPLDAIQFHGLYPLSLGFSAIATALLFDRNLKSLSLRKFSAKYLWQTFGVAVFILVIPFVVNLLLQVAHINPEPRFDEGLIIAGIPVLIILAMGEELMWRGLLYTELSKRYSFVTTSLVIGVLWSVWHYPVIIHTRFIYADRPLWFALIAFTMVVISASFVY